MRRNLAILLCMILASCAGLHGPKPENRNIAADEKIAIDTVNQLVRLYPPARTRFNLVLIEPQSFGVMLIEKLRGKGYAVSETSQTTRRFPFDTFGRVFQPGQDSEVKTDTKAAGTELRYTLDDPRDNLLVRITVNVGGAYLARAYLADSGSVAAAGAWTFRENK